MNNHKPLVDTARQLLTEHLHRWPDLIGPVLTAVADNSPDNDRDKNSDKDQDNTGDNEDALLLQRQRAANVLQHLAGPLLLILQRLADPPEDSTPRSRWQTQWTTPAVGPVTFSATAARDWLEGTGAPAITGTTTWAEHITDWNTADIDFPRLLAPLLEHATVLKIVALDRTAVASVKLELATDKKGTHDGTFYVHVALANGPILTSGRITANGIEPNRSGLVAVCRALADITDQANDLYRLLAQPSQESPHGHPGHPE